MTATESFFDALKQHRESQNIEISEICDFTKINPKYIHAIESGEFQILPTVYMRLFLRAYADFIGADSVKALEAVMDGYRVMKMIDAAKVGEVFITVTGGMNAIGREVIKNLKSGAIIANSGHFNVEIDIDALEDESDSSKDILNFVKQYTLYDGRQIFLLGEGRLINLAAAEGHPSGVMDLSFAGQALAVEYIKNNNMNLNNAVHSLPVEIDKEIALLKLQGMDVDIDILTEEQEKYLSSWDIGT